MGKKKKGSYRTLKQRAKLHVKAELGGLRSALRVQSRKCPQRAGFQSGHVAEAPDLRFHTTLFLRPNHTFPLNLRKAQSTFSSEAVS